MPAETQPPQYYRELFTENGTGGLCDYWRTATCGASRPDRVAGVRLVRHEPPVLGRATTSRFRATAGSWSSGAIDAAHATGST